MARKAKKRPGTKKSKRRRGATKRTKKILLAKAVLDDPALSNLNKIKHIIVLMLENRSFDHMLGYQKLRGRPVNGLSPRYVQQLQG
jgi:phospholipase C